MNSRLLNEVNEIKKMMGLLNEQNTDFLEKSYVKPLLDKGYKEVTNIDLPNGDYLKSGGGNGIDLKNSDGSSTGYIIVTTDGIRGLHSGEIRLTGGNLPDDYSVYKIMYNKDMKGKKDKPSVNWGAMSEEDKKKLEELRKERDEVVFTDEKRYKELQAEIMKIRDKYTQ